MQSNAAEVEDPIRNFSDVLQARDAVLSPRRSTTTSTNSNPPQREEAHEDPQELHGILILGIILESKTLEYGHGISLGHCTHDT